MESISLTINGTRLSCPPGQSILQAAEAHDIKIPTLCYHHSLKPFGACRLCLVEDEKSGRIFASCVTPAAAEMVIHTHSPQVIAHRRTIVSLMMAEHPESCIVCNKGNRCHLRMIAAELGIGDNALYPMPNFAALEQANPYITRDLSKCILCGKCIRADHELVCAGAIDYNSRGFNSRPVTLHELPLEKSSCTFCGTCVSICPTGALSAKMQFVGTPEKESTSICGFCGVGCSLELGVAGDKIVDVNPSHLKNSVNDATLCVRGHFAHDFLNSKKRLTQPLIRTEEDLTPTTWDEALETAAQRMLEIKERYGPDSIAFLGSSKCTNEENYLFQKIARTIFQTNHVDNGGYMSGRLFLDLVDKRTDRAGRFNFFAGPFSGLEQAEVVFVVGAEPSQAVPVFDYYLKRSARKGIPLILANHRKIGLTGPGSIWIHPQGTPPAAGRTADTFYLELINLISALLLDKEAFDTSFVSRFTSGFERYQEELLSLSREDCLGKADLDAQTIALAVDLLAGKKITFVVGDGLMLHRYGKETMDALLNLALMTGSIGYKGAGFHIVSKENNLVGAWDMGAVPDALPGRLKVARSEDRARWEKAWGVKIPESRGMDLLEIIKSAENGRLKALYIMGENPLRSLPQPDLLLNALKSLKCLIVQDILFSETAGIADVVLPAAAFSEKAGSFTNMEGKIQCFSPAVPPPGLGKPDLEILTLFAEKLAAPGNTGSHQQIRKEISSVITSYSNGAACKHPIWIREKAQPEDSQAEEHIRFSPVATSAETEADGRYPFTAFFRSLRFHLGSGTRTEQSSRITAGDEQGEIEVAPADAEKMSLADNDRIRVTSAAGTIERNIRINPKVEDGHIYIPTAFEANGARLLLRLEPFLENDSGGWSSCAVAIDKAETMTMDR